MTRFGEEARVQLWIALGNQPGLAAGHAVWLLSQLLPRASKPALPPETTTAPAPRPTRRVRAGVRSHPEQPRP